MVEVWLPYGKTEVPIRIPDENFLGVIAAEVPVVKNPVEEIIRAINNPIGSENLDKLAKAGNRTGILLNDLFFPYRIVLPVLIEKLTQMGLKEADIVLILGSKIQQMKPTISKELEEIAKDVKIARATISADEFTYVGDTSQKTKILINKMFLETDLRISTGRIGFHPYMGYSGGRNAVFPAICGDETIRRINTLILDPKAKPRQLDGNPINSEVEEIAQMVNVNFSINVVLNERGEIVRGFTGDLNKAFSEGVRFLEQQFIKITDKSADIVIFSSGGDPWDTTLYHGYEGLASALNVVKKNGIIIWLAESREGYGNTTVLNWMTTFKKAEEVAREIRSNYTSGGEMAYLLLKAIERVKIILVSILPDYSTTGILKVRVARTANAALNLAFRTLNRKSKVLVLPHGNSIFPIISDNKEIKNEKKFSD